MDRKEQDERTAMAMLRFSLISPCLNGTYPQASKAAYYRDVSQRPVTLPDGEVRYFNPNTLNTWECRYRRGGFDALMQKQRADVGSSRKIDDDVAAAIRAIRSKYPKMNATEVRKKLVEDGVIDDADGPSLSTVQRFVRLERKSGRAEQARDRKAFEEEWSNGMWQADTLYGPYVDKGDGKLARVYLQMIVDDKSRMIVAGRFYLSDSAANFQSTLKGAVRSYGIPRKLYVDNGAPYANAALTGICGRLGTVLLHTPVRDGASKGKVERNFRTLRERFLNCLDTKTHRYTLDEINDLLGNYIVRHNATVHSAHGEAPVDVWTADAGGMPPKMPESDEWLADAFRVRDIRRVRKDATVCIMRDSYDAPAHLIGSKIEVRYTPGDPDDAWAVDEDGTVKRIQLTDKVANGRAKRNATAYQISYSDEGGE